MNPDGAGAIPSPDAAPGRPPQREPGPPGAARPADKPADRQPVVTLEELLAARGTRLLHAAVLLAGSHADGEDLLQAALERVYRHWRRIDGDPEGYLRTTLYHLAADGWRRKGMLRARLGMLRQPEALPDETAVVDRRDELVQLLRVLPPRQRTAISCWTSRQRLTRPSTCSTARQ